MANIPDPGITASELTAIIKDMIAEGLAGYLPDHHLSGDEIAAVFATGLHSTADKADPECWKKVFNGAGESLDGVVLMLEPSEGETDG